MRWVLAFLVATVALEAPALAEAPTPAAFDWKQWRSLPVQDAGRYKPLDSLAWETWRMIANRASMADPESGQLLDSTALYLTMLFDWHEAEPGASPHGAMGPEPRNSFFGSRQPDKWDRMPLVLVDSVELRKALGMPDHTRYISPLDLSQASIRTPHAIPEETPFFAWVDKLVSAKQQRGSSELERKGVELGERLWAYREHRAGRRLEVLPLSGSAEHAWISLAELRRSKLDAARDPTGILRKVQQQLQQVQAAYAAGNAEQFNSAAAALIADLQARGPDLGDYPVQQWIDLEVAYNHWAPFRFAWVLALAACLCTLLSMGSGWRSFYHASLVGAVLSLTAMAVGFGLRVAISGRAPVTDMYESVVYVGLGVMLLGLIFELVYRKQFILMAAAAVSTVALILADNCPVLLDPSLRPLQPVLRSNFWLVTHVMTITLSYAAFALALGISDITLAYYLVRARRPDTITALSKFTYRATRVGVLLLAAGTILGGVWADYSWGRFWGWDPKEVWALVALLGYLAVLHIRYVRWVGDLGFAVLCVICFSLVVMAWYGVNFVLGAGLHSYGFGGGGQGYVYAALGAQLLYVILAAVRAPQR